MACSCLGNFCQRVENATSEKEEARFVNAEHVIQAGGIVVLTPIIANRDEEA